MSARFAKGDRIYKAVWPRSTTGMIMLTGRVLLASDASFYVGYGEGAGENLPQGNPEGWCPTQDGAMADLLDRLGLAERNLTRDVLKLKTRIITVKTLRASLAEECPHA